jgi:hypothetical protein
VAFDAEQSFRSICNHPFLRHITRGQVGCATLRNVAIVTALNMWVHLPHNIIRFWYSIMHTCYLRLYPKRNTVEKYETFYCNTYFKVKCYAESDTHVIALCVAPDCTFSHMCLVRGTEGIAYFISRMGLCAGVRVRTCMTLNPSAPVANFVREATFFYQYPLRTTGLIFCKSVLTYDLF